MQQRFSLAGERNVITGINPVNDMFKQVKRNVFFRQVECLPRTHAAAIITAVGNFYLNTFRPFRKDIKCSAKYTFYQVEGIYEIHLPIIQGGKFI